MTSWADSCKSIWTRFIMAKMLTGTETKKKKKPANLSQIKSNEAKC